MVYLNFKFTVLAFTKKQKKNHIQRQCFVNKVQIFLIIIFQQKPSKNTNPHFFQIQKFIRMG